MTIKPKVKNFRIRRPRSGASKPMPTSGKAALVGRGSVPEAASSTDAVATSPAGSAAAQTALNPMEQLANAPHEDGFPKEGFRPETAQDAPKDEAMSDSAPETGAESGSQSRAEAPLELTTEQQIEAIRSEGLTARQLRMARRVARKHGIKAETDFEAVRQLRNAGINPFERVNMLELVDAAPGASAGFTPNLPQTAPQASVPAMVDPFDGARSVLEIQKDIARRRRQKIRRLFMRLAVFVFLPTIVAGYYYFQVATPMYATKSEFVIQKADSSGGTMGSLFAGSGFATSQDSITVQSYLTSRDAMQRLDNDHGYKAHFSDPAIDVIQRLKEGATNEAAFKLYKKNVKIGFDPSEGIIKMEVIAATPEASAQFSEALISYAEERVDQLTQRLREDQLRGSIESFAESERKMLAAEAEVLRLQEEMGVFDAVSDASALMSQINGYEIELQNRQLILQQLLDNDRPNQARVDSVQGEIDRLQALVDDLRSRLTDAGGATGSVAAMSGRLRVAQTNLQTRTLMMQASLQQLETARIEANKQTRYLELGVRPVAPDEPTYPRAFEDTLLSFMIFAGIYLMASLTASILREQVSA